MFLIFNNATMELVQTHRFEKNRLQFIDKSSRKRTKLVNCVFKKTITLTYRIFVFIENKIIVLNKH